MSEYIKEKDSFARGWFFGVVTMIAINFMLFEVGALVQVYDVIVAGEVSTCQ